MAYTDKTIQCVDCGVNFTFSAQEQEFFAQKGYANDPKRCPPCRQVRKTESGGGMQNRASPSPQPARPAASPPCCPLSLARETFLLPRVLRQAAIPKPRKQPIITIPPLGHARLAPSSVHFSVFTPVMLC